MGSDPIVIPTLNALFNEHAHQIKLDAIFTQPDRRTGRGKKLTPNAVKRWAMEHSIPVHQPDKLGEQAIQQFKDNNWDLCLVMAYGHIIKQQLLDTPRFGFYNLHASILPKLRGASPIETAIVTGESETGVTLMKMVKALDAGPILSTQKQVIETTTNALELRSQLGEACIPLLKNSLHKILDDTATLTSQDESNASYCRLIDKQDGEIDFDLDPQHIYNHIRGLHPWPGATFKYQDIPFKVGSAKTVDIPDELNDQPNGTLISNGKSIIIRCKNGALQIETIQKPGGKMIPTNALLNGLTFDSPTRLHFSTRYPFTSPKYFKKH